MLNSVSISLVTFNFNRFGHSWYFHETLLII